MMSKRGFTYETGVVCTCGRKMLAWLDDALANSDRRKFSIQCPCGVRRDGFEITRHAIEQGVMMRAFEDAARNVLRFLELRRNPEYRSEVADEFERRCLPPIKQRAEEWWGL